MPPRKRIRASAPSPEQIDADLASGKRIRDYVSGEPVMARPEEVDAVQPTAQQLVEDYGYPVTHLQTHPQHRVKSRPSDTRHEYPVDIAIFHTEEKRPEDLYVVVEAKKSGAIPEEGNDRQLFNYMRLSAAELGMWTNGEERQFFRKISNKAGVSFEQIPNLPRFGETVDEVGKYRRENLVAPRHLSATFRSIRSHLAGNAVGTTRDEALATELINLVFCKIYDEKFTAPGDLVQFRVAVGEDPEAVRKRITRLFDNVKQKYEDVFSPGEKVSLDGQALVYVVGALQRYCLIDAPRDAVGEAFEVFIGTTLKGAQGQFFTPRNVIQLLVQITSPQPNELVVDPACGPAGFLVESLRYKWQILEAQAKKWKWSDQALAEERTGVAMKTINGVEKDSFLAKVAKAYMAIMGDGKGGIFCEDSLDLPSNWGKITQQSIFPERFDVVLANPPFGKDIRVVGAEKLSQFSLGHKYKDGSPTSKLEDSQNPQILFVERCIQLAKDGGRIGLVLPETYFHAPSVAHVTKMMTEHNVIALIDLPHNTFRPFNNAKCVAIVIEKNKPQQEDILMVMAEEMGHNHLGKPVYRYDAEQHQVTDVIWDDLAAASEELRSGKTGRLTFHVSAQEVKENGIFIPRFYWRPLAAAPLADGIEPKTINDLIHEGALTISAGHGSPASAFKGKGTYPYVRVKDIINWEVYRNPTSLIPKEQYEGLSKKNPLQVEDILYVARGSYRIGDVAIVGPEDTEAAITREIHILRVTKENPLELSPYYLLYLLSAASVTPQTRARVFMDTTMPTIGDRYRTISLPWHKDAGQRKAIANRVETVLRSKWQAMGGVRDLLAEIRPEIDTLVQDEAVEPPNLPED